VTHARVCSGWVKFDPWGGGDSCARVSARNHRGYVLDSARVTRGWVGKRAGGRGQDSADSAESAGRVMVDPGFRVTLSVGRSRLTLSSAAPLRFAAETEQRYSHARPELPPLASLRSSVPPKPSFLGWRGHHGRPACQLCRSHNRLSFPQLSTTERMNGHLSADSCPGGGHLSGRPVAKYA
jgi:hypothetical protein